MMLTRLAWRTWAPVWVLGLSACAPLHALTRSQDTRTGDVPPGVYRLDPRHCSVIFAVDHLGFSQFTMRFDRVSATLDWPSAGITRARVDARIATSSIDTNVRALDAALCASSMLDCQHQSELHFVGAGWRPTGPASGDLQGLLQLGSSQEAVLLHVRFNGYGVDPVTGLPTLGFSARGRFSRGRLGLHNWPGLIGDTVRLRIEAEFVAAAGS